MADPIVQLNDRWRVSDDPPQWTLEERDGKAREKATGWAARKFIRDRDHLLRRIGELCGRCDPQALAAIRTWPTGYVQWKVRRLDSRGSHESARPAAISAPAVHPPATPAQDAA